MKKFTLLFFILLFFNSSFANEATDDSSLPNDYKIAKTIRQAVRVADKELLNATLLGTWRDYLKVVAMDLDVQTQPLILIKFDEDMNFRNQLKKVIEWEVKYEKRETRNYVYYYDWENPIPEVILDVQDAHFEEITNLFAIEIDEKLPYRYDLDVEKSSFHPLEELDGGVMSPNPFDLEKTTHIIFSYVNPDLPYITQPLAKIYGDYFENPATAKAYYEKCLEQIKLKGYYSMVDLFEKHIELSEESQEWFSAYAFVYLLSQEFTPVQLTKFIESVNSEMTRQEFIATFELTFGKPLAEVELNSDFQQYVKKL